MYVCIYAFKKIPEFGKYKYLAKQVKERFTNLKNKKAKLNPCGSN